MSFVRVHLEVDMIFFINIPFFFFNKKYFYINFICNEDKNITIPLTKFEI